MANVILSKLATDNINEILANVYEFTGFISNPHFHLKSVACIHDFVRSVHLDARQISPRCGMKCGDFWACFFVQQVARYGARLLFLYAATIGIFAWGVVC